MSDHCSEFTSRAKAWVRESDPSREEIHDAYRKMKSKILKEPDIDQGDSDECLEYLVEAYQSAGGDVDDLLLQTDSVKSDEHRSDDYTFDASPLCPVAEVTPLPMTKEEKQRQFNELKALLRKSA